MSTVSETAVSLRFSGDDLDPAQIAQALGGQPEIAYRKGEPMGWRQRHRPDRAMFVQSTKGESRDLDSQICELLDGLSSDLVIWRELAQQYRGELFIGLFLNGGNQGIGLEALHLSVWRSGAADRSRYLLPGP